jgi:hypothetical protein
MTLNCVKRQCGRVVITSGCYPDAFGRADSNSVIVVNKLQLKFKINLNLNYNKTQYYIVWT